MRNRLLQARRLLLKVPPLYRFLLWLVRCLLPAIQTGFWTLYHTHWSRCAYYLYSTEARGQKSFLYRLAMSPRFGPPFKTFSAYQALRCGYPPLAGRIVLEDQGWPRVEAGSLLANGLTQQHITQPWPVFWSAHRHVRLVSSSLALVTDDKRLCLESVYGEGFARQDPASCHLRLPPATVLPGNWTSVVSRWTPNRAVPNHSHWLLDALPRLAVLGEFPSDTGIILPQRLAAYQQESLRMLGIGPERWRFSPETHLQIGQYFFSAPPSLIVCYSPYAVKFLRASFLPKADPQFHGPRRFFVRRPWPLRHMENDAEVERFFEEIGWACLDLANLAFAQEIKLFSEAEAVCGMLGSGVNNIIFSRPECAVVGIAHDYWTDGVLDWIAQTVGVSNYSVLVCPSDACRPFMVNVGALRRHLAERGLLS